LDDVGEDLLGRLVPHERLGIVIPVPGPHLDGAHKFIDRGEDVPAELSFDQLGEPPLNEVEPRRTGRGAVQVSPVTVRVRQPPGHRLCLVWRQVVEDDVDSQVRRNVQVDPLEEGQHVGPVGLRRRSGTVLELDVLLVGEGKRKHYRHHCPVATAVAPDLSAMDHEPRLTGYCNG